MTVTLEDGASFELDHGAVVISTIASSTNTSEVHDVARRPTTAR